MYFYYFKAFDPKAQIFISANDISDKDPGFRIENFAIIKTKKNTCMVHLQIMNYIGESIIKLLTTT